MAEVLQGLIIALRSDQAPHAAALVRSRGGPPVRTSVLIAELSADLRPAPPRAQGRHELAAVAIGAGLSALLLHANLGYRPDLGVAAAAPRFWLKLAYGVVLSAIALWVLAPLSRPGGNASSRYRWLAAPIALLAVLSASQLAQAPAVQRMPMLLGRTADVCSAYIVLFALLPLAGLLYTIRRQASTRPALTGAVIGLAAGGLGAAVYALHCGEASLPFLLIWYTLGMALTSALGAMVGAWLLRW